LSDFTEIQCPGALWVPERPRDQKRNRRYT